jgi:hypothetical protein
MLGPRPSAALASPDRVAITRYERITGRHSARPGDVAAAFADASAGARSATPASSGHEVAIRDVAAGVASPALVGFTAWMFRQARTRNLTRLRFLSRDGQVLYELARRLAPRLGIDIDMEYVYSSRLTWSLAATDPASLTSAEWLFNSFMKSNATDLCARLGLPAADYVAALAEAGVSMDPETRADAGEQLMALRQFLRRDDVSCSAAARIGRMRAVVTEYAAQHMLAHPRTGLVDVGWTGRMAGSLINVCAAYLYNTARGEGLG